MSEILIVSTSIDEPTYGPVAEKINSKGHEVVTYLADKVSSGIDKLSIVIGVNGNADPQVRYNDANVSFSTLKSAWYRHPNLFGFELDDKAKQMCLEQEISDLQDSLWLFVPEEAWLNSPTKMRKAQPKLAQLVLAQQLGFFWYRERLWEMSGRILIRPWVKRTLLRKCPEESFTMGLTRKPSTPPD